MGKYDTCKICGAHLDHGEKCRCIEERCKEIEVRRSGTGMYFLCDSGGRSSVRTRGKAQVLAGKQGEPLKCYSRLREINGDHALCKVEPGHYVIQVQEWIYGYPEIDVYRIEEFAERNGKSYAVCFKIYRDCHGTKEFWGTPVEIVDMLCKAIESAIGMAEAVCTNKPGYVRVDGI